MIENALPDDPTPKPLKTTPLDAWHRALGARMVEFAGYAMPVQYQGVLAEHLHCRAQAALFDVSHMGQATLTGATAAAALERLVPGDMLGLKPGRQRYTLLTNEAGGILDDLMVANLGGETAVPGGERQPQGRSTSPTSPPTCRPACSFIRTRTAPCWRCKVRPPPTVIGAHRRRRPPQLPFMGVAAVTLAGIPCLVSRSGYTGEDGFEISRARRQRRGARAAACWTKPRWCPPASARAIRCGWRRGSASTATTSTN